MSRYFGPICHIAYMVPNLEAAMAHWITGLGVGPWFREDHFNKDVFHYKGAPIEIRSRVALAYSGDLNIELIEEQTTGPSPNREFIEEFAGGRDHVAGGMHHVGILVPDLDRALGQ